MHIEILEPERRHIVACHYAPPFTRLPAIEAHPFRGYFEWPDEGPTTALAVIDLSPFRSVFPRPHQRNLDESHKADPDWDTKFSTKLAYPTPIPTNVPLATPKGTLASQAMHAFLTRAGEFDREAEIAYIESTQHLELATTLQEFKANGMTGYSLSSAPNGMDADNISGEKLPPTLTDEEAAEVPPICNPQFVSAMQNRIMWEKMVCLSGITHRFTFERARDGSLGVVYNGPERDTKAILELKRGFVRATIERDGRLPTVESLINNKVYAQFYKKPVLALMTDDEYNAYHASKKYGTEDPDPGRKEFHRNPDPKPERDDYEEDTPAGWDEYNADVALWRKRQVDRGYAGPSGLLGIDDATDDDSIFVSS